MNFENLKKTWEALAQENPMWAVMTAGKSRDFQWNREQFYEAGVIGFTRILEQVKLIVELPEIKRSLDFGCGVGRLTFPLAGISEFSVGVDVSASMIGLAQDHAKRNSISNCDFIHNTKENLSLFEDSFFDFIVSMMVLQHMEPSYFKAYLSEFLRLLRPGGILVFQLPHHIEKKASYDQFHEATAPEMEIYGMNREEVIQLLDSRNTRIKGILEDDCCGPNIRSFRYILSKSTDL